MTNAVRPSSEPHRGATPARIGAIADALAHALDRWRYPLIALVALAQAGILVHMIAGREMLLADGRQIDLDVIPVDPRDFFRGDYVTLRYAISRLPQQLVDAKGAISRGDRLHVRLRKKDDEWQAVAASRGSLTASGPDEVVLSGQVRYASVGGPTRAGSIDIDYGIEKFFVPEGTGRDIEKDVRDKKVVAHVAVAPDGTAALKGLTVAGKRYEMPPLFGR